MGSKAIIESQVRCLESLRVDRQSVVPLHVQISEGLSDLIRTDQLSVGQSMPTNRQMVEVLEVDYKTVQRAMTTLADQRIVARYRGKGTFVRQAPPAVGVMGVVICGFDDALGHEASAHLRGTLYHLQSQLEREGRPHRFYFCSRDEYSANAAFSDLMTDLGSGQLSGLLLQSSRQYMESALQLAQRQHVAVATLGSHDRGRIALSSHLDWHAFVHDAAADLVEAGCRRLGVVYNIKSDLLPDRATMAGWMNKGGGETCEQWVVGRPCTVEGGRQAMAQLADQGLDAVVFTDDHMASGAERWCREHGVRAPEDVTLATTWTSISGIHFTTPVVRYEVDTPEMIRKAMWLLSEVNRGRRIAQPHALTPPLRLDLMPVREGEAPQPPPNTTAASQHLDYIP